MIVANSPLASLITKYDNFYTHGQYRNALNLAHTILQTAEDNNHIQEKMYAYLKLMQCYYSLGEIENALDYIVQFRLLSEEFSTPKINFYLHLISGYIYEYEENFPKAINSFENALCIALQIKDARATALSRNLYAHLLLKNGNIEEAHKYATESYNFIQQNLSSHLLYVSHSQHILATTCIEINQLPLALQILEQLKKNPILAYNKKEQSRFYFAYGSYYLKLEQFNKAIFYFKQAEEIAFQSNDFILQKRICKLYATIYAAQNDFKQAYANMQNYAHLLEKTLKMSFVSKAQELDLKRDVLLVERSANTDLLSGLHNRSYAEKMANEWLSTASTENIHICCIAFDVDNFKAINDTYGHLVGDEVIKHIGKCCSSIFSNKDAVCARYGGDEFVIILKNYGKDNIHSDSQALFTKITSNPLTIDKIVFNLSISMGITCNEFSPSKHFTQLFHTADQALYMAKRKGKNQILVMSSIS